MKQRKFTKLTVHSNGQTYTKTVGFRSLDELADKKRKFEQECEYREKHFFQDVADQWFEQHQKTIEHYTIRSYLSPLKDLKAEYEGVELKDITAISFQSFMNRMQLQGYAKQTINIRKVTMAQILDYGIMCGMIPYNPVKACKVPKAPKTPRLPPSDDEIEKIRSAQDSMWKKYFLLLMYSGLRKEEALALTKDDLNFENCTITVNKVLIHESNTPRIRNYTKTAAGERLAPFPINLHSYFQNASKGLIFAHHGKPLTKGEFDYEITKFKKENGITCSSHQLRHYFASLCHDVIDAKDAQALLGHANITTTLDIYTHIDKRKKQAAIQKLNEHIQNL